MTEAFIAKLDNLLGEVFKVDAPTIANKLKKIGRELPDELSAELRQLLSDSQGLQKADLADFAFRCGSVYAQLDEIRKNKLAAEIAFVQVDGTAPVALEEEDLNSIARFLKWRDQALKTVTDYTLKFLLVASLLLVAGLALGLI